ncbi:hypothetical protein PVK06_014092 [Gossypium arboreum]|uniref:Uncharacterized protein n=1 Tax=Gossypium arboreum TaxID=29729 RepID=A0ABR0PU45_GOSAR|nr:hypothetical protein PVK06_014092 [Gossypium arboreum]
MVQGNTDKAGAKYCKDVKFIEETEIKCLLGLPHYFSASTPMGFTSLLTGYGIFNTWSFLKGCRATSNASGSLTSKNEFGVFCFCLGNIFFVLQRGGGVFDGRIVAAQPVRKVKLHSWSVIALLPVDGYDAETFHHVLALWNVMPWYSKTGVSICKEPQSAPDHSTSLSTSQVNLLVRM